MARHLILKTDGQNWCEEVNSKLCWSQNRSQLSSILWELGLSVSQRRLESFSCRNLELAETQSGCSELIPWEMTRKMPCLSMKLLLGRAREWPHQDRARQLHKRELIMPWFIVTGCAINTFMEVFFFSFFLSFFSKRLCGWAQLPGPALTAPKSTGCASWQGPQSFARVLPPHFTGEDAGARGVQKLPGGHRVSICQAGRQVCWVAEQSAFYPILSFSQCGQRMVPGGGVFSRSDLSPGQPETLETVLPGVHR